MRHRGGHNGEYCAEKRPPAAASGNFPWPVIGREKTMWQHCGNMRQQIPHILRRGLDAILVFLLLLQEEDVRCSVAPVFEVFSWVICKLTYLFLVETIIGCVLNVLNTFFGV